MTIHTRGGYNWSKFIFFTLTPTLSRQGRRSLRNSIVFYFFKRQSAAIPFNSLRLVAFALNLAYISLLANYPQIDWKKVKGTRDIFSHHYFAVDAEAIYTVCVDHIKVLAQVINKIIYVNSAVILKPKNYTPVARHRYGPITFILSLQRVKIKPR
jgi:hypothetical protein